MAPKRIIKVSVRTTFSGSVVGCENARGCESNSIAKELGFKAPK